MLVNPSLDMPLPSSTRPGAQDQAIAGLEAAREAGVDHDLLIEMLTPYVERHYGSPSPVWWSLLALAHPTAEEPWPLTRLLIEPSVAPILSQVVVACASCAQFRLAPSDLKTIFSAPRLLEYMSAPISGIEVVGPGFNVARRNRGALFVGRKYCPMSARDLLDTLETVAKGWLTSEHLTAKTSSGLNHEGEIGQGPVPVGGGRWGRVAGSDDGDWLFHVEINEYVTPSRRKHIRDSLTSLLHSYNAPTDDTLLHGFGPKLQFAVRVDFMLKREAWARYRRQCKRLAIGI